MYSKYVNLFHTEKLEIHRGRKDEGKDLFKREQKILCTNARYVVNE
jgi:hypothetical protein